MFKRTFGLFINFVKEWFHFFRPPPEWRLVVTVLMGIFIGLCIYLYRISNAPAYLSNDPKACINCHLMVPQYATWQHSSHARVANCVDCHVPHDSIFKKYAFKIKDGTRHAYIFTIHAEPQVIQIKEDGMAVVQENCIRCHLDVLGETALKESNYEGFVHDKNKLCWDCHREVPHGIVHSQAATPDAWYPQLPSTTPAWLKPFIPLIDRNVQIQKEDQ